MVFSQSFSQKQPVAAKILESAVKHDQLVSAYLLTGSVTEDKWLLVRELANYLNCAEVASGAKNACALSKQHISADWCTSCRWLADEQHPQALLTLSGAQSKSGKIGVEQARELIEEISKTSAYKRIVVVEDAGQEALHRPAANALLRTIEEPRSDVVLIFFVQALSEVLATIASRCQIIHMSNNMYKQDRFFSLFNGRLQQNDFCLDKLIVVEEEGKQDVLAAIDRFAGQDFQFIDAVNLAETIQTLVKEKTDLDIVLDFLVTKELLGLKNPLSMQNEARYAKELFLLSQIAKEQGKHYVGQKAVVETFVFAWYKLKQTGVNPLKVRG